MSSNLVPDTTDQRSIHRKRNALLLLMFSLLVVSSAIFLTTPDKDEIVDIFAYTSVLDSTVKTEPVIEGEGSAVLSQNSVDLKHSAALDFILVKNSTPVKVVVNHPQDFSKRTDFIETTLQEVGFEYSFLNKEHMDYAFFVSRTLASLVDFVVPGTAAKSTEIELVFHQDKWESFLAKVNTDVARPSKDAALVWTETSGWQIEEEVSELELDVEHALDSIDRYKEFVRDTERERITLRLKTISPDYEEFAARNAKYKGDFSNILHKIEQPVLFKIDEQQYQLDLKSEQDFVVVTKDHAELNSEKILNWIDVLAEMYYIAPTTVHIVDRFEVRPGSWQAVTEGEFGEGTRLDLEEIYSQLQAVLEPKEDEANSERVVEMVKRKIPVRVYSDLENIEYELLAVGYSEYSRGNEAYRVHNIKTGLGRIDNTLVGKDEVVSFNRSVGSIDYDFEEGYSIFGDVARKNLGGGICQVSTTFYRALLNLGIPITMRKNHSWDLTYYHAGGYGLDATVFPAQGLDVKAVNTLPSSIYFRSYTNDETEEAFVLAYGVSDGRSVELVPDKEYVFFRGPKTTKWTRIVTWPDGHSEEDRIVSYYKK